MRGFNIIGLNHLQKGKLGDMNACYGFGSSQWEPVAIRNATSQGQVGLYVNTANKLVFAVNDTVGTTKAGCTQIKLSKLIDNAADVAELTIGMRLDAAPYTPSITSAYPLVCLYAIQPAVGATNGPQSTLVIQPSANVAAASGYYEFVFTLTAVGAGGGRIDIYLDKVFQGYTTLASTIGRTNIGNYYLSFGRMAMVCYNSTTPGLGGADTVLFTMEDIYCVYDTVVQDGSTRKGPMKIRPLDVDTNNDVAWQTSDGSARAACLNLADHHGTILTPYVLSPLDMTAIKLRRVTTPISDSDKILCIAGATSASRDVGQSANISAKWKFNSSESAATSYLPTSGDYTTQKDFPLVTLQAMPDGSPFTKAKLADLEMVLTPV